MVIGCRGAGGGVEFEMTGEEVGDIFGASYKAALAILVIRREITGYSLQDL